MHHEERAKTTFWIADLMDARHDEYALLEAMDVGMPYRLAKSKKQEEIARSMKNQKVLVVGGSSGMGLAIAKKASDAGASVTIASRSVHKLEIARKTLGPEATALTLDMTDPEQLVEFFHKIGELDQLVITASSVKTGSIRELGFAEALASMQSKFWGPYLCAKHAKLKLTGSIIMFSGVLSRKPAKGLAAIAGINAAVEGLGRALALELAPVRVNVISPGFTDTGVYDGMGPERRQAFFDGTARALPVGRIGLPDDVAEAALMLMTNGFITGITLDVDGGGAVTGTLPN